MIKDDLQKKRDTLTKEKSLYEYKIGEIVDKELMNGTMRSPNKLVRISYTYQSKDEMQMEVSLKHKDFIEDILEDFEYHTNLLIKAYINLSFSDFKIAFKELDIDIKHLWRQYTTTYRNNLLSFMNMWRNTLHYNNNDKW